MADAQAKAALQVSFWPGSRIQASTRIVAGRLGGIALPSISVLRIVWLSPLLLVLKRCSVASGIQRTTKARSLVTWRSSARCLRGPTPRHAFVLDNVARGAGWAARMLSQSLGRPFGRIAQTLMAIRGRRGQRVHRLALGPMANDTVC